MGLAGFVFLGVLGKGVRSKGVRSKGRGSGFGRRSQRKEHILITSVDALGFGDLELFIALHYLRATSMLREMGAQGSCLLVLGPGMDGTKRRTDAEFILLASNTRRQHRSLHLIRVDFESVTTRLRQTIYQISFLRPKQYAVQQSRFLVFFSTPPRCQSKLPACWMNLFLNNSTQQHQTYNTSTPPPPGPPPHSPSPSPPSAPQTPWPRTSPP